MEFQNTTSGAQIRDQVSNYGFKMGITDFLGYGLPLVFNMKYMP